MDYTWARCGPVNLLLSYRARQLYGNQVTVMPEPFPVWFNCECFAMWVRISGFTIQAEGTLNHELKNKGMMKTVHCVCSEKLKLAMLRKSKHNVISSGDINFHCVAMGKVPNIEW